MTVAGTLEIQLLANIARLQSDMTQAKGAVGSAMKSIESSVAMAKNALGALGIGLGVGYFTSLIKGTIDAADKINDLSQSTGIAVRELGKYKLATEQSGATLESLAKGVKGLATAFAEHGAELKAAGINAQTTDGRMRQIADVFAAMPDGIEKTTLAVKLFGKSGMELIPMLNMGSAGLAETAEKSAQYAAVLATLAPQADRFNDTLAELGMASKVASMSLINDALPAMTRIAAAMALAAQEAGVFKAALVGLGGVVIEGLGGWGRALHLWWLQLNSYLDSAGAKLARYLGMSKEAGVLENSASEFAVKAQRLLEENPPDALNPKKVFDPDKWVAQYKTMLGALGLESKKESAKAAGMTFDQLLQKSQEYLATRSLQDEEAATREYNTRVAANQAAWEKMGADDAAALAVRLDTEAATDAWIGQLRLTENKRILDEEAAARKKATDEEKALQIGREKEITRGLTDALMRGFDAGKGFARSFWDSMVAMAKTVVLRPLIEAALSPVSAAASTGMSMLGLSSTANAAGSVLTGGGAIGSLVAGYQGATLAAGLAGPTTAAAGGMTGIGAAMAAIPGWGWAALGAAAIVGFMSKGGGPKDPNLGLTRSAGGLAMVTQNDFGASSLNPAQAQEMNLWLQQLPPRLQTAIDGMVVSLSPGATPHQAWEQLQAQIKATADSLGLTTDELDKLGTIADQTKHTTALRAIEIQIMEASGDAAGALAARRYDELEAVKLSDKALVPYVQALYDAQDAATVAAKAQETLNARLEWQDKLDVLTGARTQRQVDLTNTLASVTDETTRAIIRQVFAQEDLMAAAESTASSLANLVKSVIASLKEAAAARTAANDATFQTLSTARTAVWAAYDTEATKLKTLADSMTGFGKTLRELQNSLLLGADSPLNPMDKFAAAQKQFRDLSAKAKLGDQDALAGLAGASQSYLTAGRGAFASGDAYNSIFSEVQGALGGAASTAARAAANATSQITLLQTQVSELVGIRQGVQTLASSMAAFADILRTGSLGLPGGNVNLGGAIAQARGMLSAGNLRGIYDLAIGNGITSGQLEAALGLNPGIANQWARSQNLPTFDAGTPFVPYDMTARIHQGERITPAASNDALVSGVQGMVAEIKALRADVQRLSAIVHAGETANVQATERVARTQENIAWREEVRPKAA